MTRGVHTLLHIVVHYFKGARSRFLVALEKKLYLCSTLELNYNSNHILNRT